MEPLRGNPSGTYREGNSPFRREKCAADRSNNRHANLSRRTLQFQVKYTTLQGEARMRVITLTRHWTDGGNVQDLLAGFDQEASAVIMARLLSSKMEAEEEFNATRWLDRSLIRMCSRFGDYRTEDPTSFQLSPQMSIYPQFMFNLRRSQFV